MKKHLLPLILALLTLPAFGQQLRMGAAYHQQRIKAERLRTQAAKEASLSTGQSAATAKGLTIDETSEVEGDNMYRYVFAYNKSRERSSETIYKKTRTDGGWGDEVLYNKGIYTYEYDSQDRIVQKTVRYERDDTEFTSYNIGVTYEDAYTEYSRSDIEQDGSYTERSRWSFYPNGQMRSYATINIWSPSENTFTLFDENGSCIEASRGEGSDYMSYKRTIQGSLNAPTVTTYDGDGLKRVEHYVYDPANGKLVEYKTLGRYYDAYKYEYIYDTLGRISAIRKYYSDDEDDDTSIPEEEVKRVASKAEAMAEPAWRLEYNETFTYFNDEVYGLGNTWHDVLGMDGPLVNRHLVDDDYEEGEPYVEDLTFNRDADGKLLSVVSTKTEMPDVIETNTIDVDSNGHITQEHFYFKESYTDSYNDTEIWYEDDVTITFNWETAYGTDYISTAEQTDIYRSSHGDNSTYKYSFMYMYSPDTQFIVQRSLNGSNTSYAEVRTANKGIKISQGDSRFVQEVQTEDVRFVRPNLIKDYDGFYPDSTIIVSVKDRVVACRKQGDTSNSSSYEWADFEWLGGDIEAYFNTDEDSYFSVSHEGDLTVCKNIDDLPVYILQEGRLLKEYIYEDIYYNVGPVEPSAAKRLTAPSGQAITEITYKYGTGGEVVGKTVRQTDENGTVTDEVSVEVKYDQTSGVETMEIATGGSLFVNGRSIGIGRGRTFSVSTLGGHVLATSADAFQFPATGIYLITIDGKTLKLAIR